jgi:hypothetical protein
MTEGSRGERVTGTSDVTINDPDDIIGGVAGGGSGERATGTPNTVYNLSSVLFHALQGGASYDTYVEDAEQAGDEELAEFFRRVREEDRDRAAEARLLLAERTLNVAGTGGTAPRDAATEGLATGVATTEGSELDTSPGTERSGSSPGTEPKAESTSSGDARREYAVTEMADEDLRPLEEAASPRPEPTDDFPGTEPVEGEDPTASSGEVPPPPEGVPTARAGEVPMAEGVPAPRTEGVPGAEEVPSGTPPQAPPGDVQGETSRAEARSRGGEEAPQRGAEGTSLEPPTPEEEEMARRQAARDRGEEDKGLLDRIKDSDFGEGGQGRGGPDRPERR